MTNTKVYNVFNDQLDIYVDKHDINGIGIKPNGDMLTLYGVNVIYNPHHVYQNSRSTLLKQIELEENNGMALDNHIIQNITLINREGKDLDLSEIDKLTCVTITNLLRSIVDEVKQDSVEQELPKDFFDNHYQLVEIFSDYKNAKSGMVHTHKVTNSYINTDTNEMEIG